MYLKRIARYVALIALCIVAGFSGLVFGICFYVFLTVPGTNTWLKSGLISLAILLVALAGIRRLWPTRASSPTTPFSPIAAPPTHSAMKVTLIVIAAAIALGVMAVIGFAVFIVVAMSRAGGG